MARFLIDESADARLADHLAARGHDATLVARDYKPGIPDTEVLAIARAENRVLITDDRDFGELVFATVSRTQASSSFGFATL